MKKVLVVIPAYNEAENIESVVLNLERNHKNVDYVIINDCSRDNTLQICKEKGFNTITLPINIGIGGVIQTGYHYAIEYGYEIVVQMDGDGQHDSKYLTNLIKPILENDADIVIGSRFITNEGFQSSGIRRIGIKFLSNVIYFCTGIRIKDTTSGYRAVNQKFIKIYAEDYAQDYPEPEAIVAAAMHKARIQEVPVIMHERQGGVSSITYLKSIYYMFKVTLALILYRITFNI